MTSLFTKETTAQRGESQITSRSRGRESLPLCSQSEAISKSLMLNGRLHASLAFQLPAKRCRFSLVSSIVTMQDLAPCCPVGPVLPRAYCPVICYWIDLGRGDREQAVAECDANPESQLGHQSKSRLSYRSRGTAPVTTRAWTGRFI
jgi:hypothetical protein